MGSRDRTYAHENIIITIEPGPRLIWGYWGAAIRAIDSMWRVWDVIEMDFEILVETEGILGKGYMVSLDNEK